MVKNPFPQTFLMSKWGFRSFLEKRGIHISIDELESFEERGFLYPVVRVVRPTFLYKKIKKVEKGVTKEYWQTLKEGESFQGEIKKMYAGIGDITHGLYNYFKRGLIIFPSKSNFKPWKEYKDGYEETVFPFYHPYQAICVKEILNKTRLTINGVPELEENEMVKRMEKLRKFDEIRRKHLFKRLKEYQKFIRLLLLIQDRYLPFIRKKFVGKGGVNFEELWNKWFEWTDKFDPHVVLKESGFSIEQIKKWRLHFAAQAGFTDPLRRWYILVHHIPYSKREKLKGDALLAQDYYEITEMLGRFLTDLTGEKQLDADDLLDARRGEWKKEWYGREVDYKNREVLQKVLTEYGINPQDRLLLIVEGETEYEAVRRIAQAMGFDLDQLGIRILHLKGAGEIAKKRIEKLLEYLALAPATTIPYIILDNHPNVKKTLETLKALELIRPDHYRIWKKEFEEDNFSDEEVLQQVVHQAKERGFVLKISAEMIEKERQAKRKEGKPVPHLTKILQKIMYSFDYEIDKPELGKALAKIVADRIEKQEKYTSTTEIEKEILKIVKLATS